LGHRGLVGFEGLGSYQECGRARAPTCSGSRSRDMKQLPAILLLLLLAEPTRGQDSPPCPIEGDTLHWIADFCMAEIGTDDEIAAMVCIDQELRRPFPDDCAAKGHYKRALCAGAISRQVVAGTLENCLEDEEFMGSTVRNRGVGN
jgi:hypothetical protein